MTAVPVAVGGDDIVRALETTLRERVPLVVEALGFEHLGEVKLWQIVPTADAIVHAELPGVAIVTPRMVPQPQRGAATYSADWEVSVGVYARSVDHESTQTQIQQWAKVLRIAGLLTRTLPGTSIEMKWAGEEYDLVPTKEDARTFAGAEVMFDAHVENAFDPSSFRTLPQLTALTHTVRPN